MKKPRQKPSNRRGAQLRLTFSAYGAPLLHVEIRPATARAWGLTAGMLLHVTPIPGRLRRLALAPALEGKGFKVRADAGRGPGNLLISIVVTEWPLCWRNYVKPHTRACLRRVDDFGRVILSAGLRAPESCQKLEAAA